MNRPDEVDPDGTRRDRLLDTPDGVVPVRVMGTGTVVLCLHGVSARGRSWEAVAERLSGRACFWLPDLLGRGGSTPRPDLTYRLDDEVRRLEDLLAVMPSPGPAVIAGHSTGASIAIALARRRSNVRGLLLSNPVTPWTRRPVALSSLGSGLMRRFVAGIFSPLRRPLATLVLRRAAGPRFRVADEVIEAYAEPYADRRRAESLLAALRDWDPSELERHVIGGRWLTRVCAGAHDPRITRETAERLAMELGGSFHLVQDGGHILPEQHPDLLAQELGHLLDEIAVDRDRTTQV